MGRRSFLALGLGAAATLAANPLEAAVRRMPERSLHLYNTHTGEWLKTVYWADGRYQAKSIAQVSRFLRDHRTGTVHAMDPKLLDLMASVHKKFGTKGALHIISGYRSPQSNAMLASTGDGVAHNSLHMQGRAVDIRMPGHSVRQIGRAAASLKAGGVGLYPVSDFVHIDTGRIRYW
ncbi:MAG: YcbK family protein [Actinomycetota bacterium]